jgi:hypothetical protein
MTARMRLSRRDRGGRWTPPKLATAPNKSETNIARIARSGPNRGNQYRFVSYMCVLFPSAGARRVPLQDPARRGPVVHSRATVRHGPSLPGLRVAGARWWRVVASVVAPLVALSGRWWARWWPRCRSRLPCLPVWMRAVLLARPDGPDRRPRRRAPCGEHPGRLDGHFAARFVLLGLMVRISRPDASTRVS